MTTSQKVFISLVLTASCYLLYAISRYWLADTKLASAQNSIRLFQATQDPQYLITAYNQFSGSFKLNPHEPAITSEYAVSAAYLANVLYQSNATAAAQLAQISAVLSQKAITQSPNHPNYYKSQARAMILLSDFDPQYLLLAVDALKKAQDISPTDPRLPYNLGVVYKYLSDATISAKLMKDSLFLKSDFADAQKQLQELIP